MSNGREPIVIDPIGYNMDPKDVNCILTPFFPYLVLSLSVVTMFQAMVQSAPAVNVTVNFLEHYWIKAIFHDVFGDGFVVSPNKCCFAKRHGATPLVKGRSTQI